METKQKWTVTSTSTVLNLSNPDHQDQIDKVREYHQAAAYQKAMRQRGYWVEPLFGEAKDFHRLRRFRLGGLLKVNIEGVMIAAG